MIRKLAVIGTGAMGKGIAQVAAQSNVETYLFDQDSSQSQKALEDIKGHWARMAIKGKISAQQLEQYNHSIHVVDSLQQLEKVDLAIEAVVESLEVKQKLFAELEMRLPKNCIFATNTSSLSITSIAAKLREPKRLAGLHFFNPVPLMKVVEVIGGLATDPETLSRLTAFVDAIGHRPVRAKDTPGFIVNHAGRGYGTEALRIVGEGITDFATVDRVLRDLGPFKMGPFELLDLTGLDVSHPVMESIYHQYYQEPRFRPSPITRLRLEGGYLGRKVGRGFYDYSQENFGQTKPPPEISNNCGILAGKRWIWIAPPSAGGLMIEAHEKVKEFFTRVGVKVEASSRPSTDAVCVVLPLGEDNSTLCAALQLNPKVTIGIDALCDIGQHVTLMTNPLTEAKTVDSLRAVCRKAGVKASVISDSPGFIAQRVIASIVNIGCDMAQQEVASPGDIDAAVSLGLGYPQGPLALGDRFGASRVLKILENMFAFYGDPRYRPSPWLKRRAILGQSLTLTEQKYVNQ